MSLGCKKRNKLSIVQQGVCPYCGMWLTGEDTLDHVFPLMRGGLKGVGNLLCVHKDCNKKKADRLPTEDEVELLCEINSELLSRGWMVNLIHERDFRSNPARATAIRSGDTK